ncbi:ATP synthase F0 subunit C [Clostridium cellulovorans]|uniref:ATP synthase subunit c n=1 Tax=Clostridium cellulovorans (strain ATCC 35296 / DSM 3052 / OCM 3 / 743B) TaxID=573061 RepID=D9STL0_CLOC7|nr:ATP synthase F0 subunit C [Clostridium cellulovorans]ADL52744.1 ATP synthase F0, C subunit [Clostridium cellulovorans 743B]
MNESFVNGMKVLAAGLAALGVVGAGIGCGNVAAKAVEGVSRQPEASSDITRTMILGIVFSEATAIYALIIAILLIFVA